MWKAKDRRWCERLNEWMNVSIQMICVLFNNSKLLRTWKWYTRTVIVLKSNQIRLELKMGNCMCACVVKDKWKWHCYFLLSSPFLLHGWLIMKKSEKNINLSTSNIILFSLDQILFEFRWEQKKKKNVRWWKWFRLFFNGIHLPPKCASVFHLHFRQIVILLLAPSFSMPPPLTRQTHFAKRTFKWRTIFWL